MDKNRVYAYPQAAKKKDHDFKVLHPNVDTTKIVYRKNKNY